MLYVYGISLYGLTSYYSSPQKVVSRLDAITEENADLSLRSQHSSVKVKEDIVKQYVDKGVGVMVVNSIGTKVGEAFCSKVM